MRAPVLYNQKDVRNLDVCTRGTIQQERHGEGYESFLEKITKCDWTISLTTN